MVFKALPRVRARHPKHRLTDEPTHRFERRIPLSPRRVTALVAAMSLPLAAIATISTSTFSLAGSDSHKAAHHKSQGTHAKKATATTRYGVSLFQGGGDSLQDAMNREEGLYGPKLGIVRLFYPGMPASWSSIESVVQGTPVLVSFKADPKAIINGSLDSQFRSWFASAPTDVRTRWSYWHEPEDDAEAGRLNLADYRAAWAHLKALADEQNNRLLRATLVLMCWTLSPNSGRDWHNYYAGDAVDLIAYDCYNAGHRGGKYQAPSKFLSLAAAVSTNIGKPWGVAELGSVLCGGDTGPGRAQWLHDSADYISSHDGKFVTYFDSDVGTDYRLHDGPSQQAWHDIVQSTING